jgi:ferrous iron transport protein B
MVSPRKLKIALVGNPNSGKSSLFNYLTGLNQKIGNFPGVTVEKKSGFCLLPESTSAEIIDLPGTYSIYPRSLDEQIVAEVLLDHHSVTTPDKVVVIVDSTNVKRGFLLLSQIIDIGLPTILALNMMDLAAKAGISYDLNALSKELGIPVIPINARNGVGLDELKKVMSKPQEPPAKQINTVWKEVEKPVQELRDRLGVDNDYEAYQLLEQPNSLKFLNKDKQKVVEDIRKKYEFFPGKFQGAETIQRYSYIQDLLNNITLNVSDRSWKQNTVRLDRILLHKVWGYVIFFALLFLIFQSIFAWAQVPMDLIDSWFAELSGYINTILPAL